MFARLRWRLKRWWQRDPVAEAEAQALIDRVEQVVWSEKMELFRTACAGDGWRRLMRTRAYHEWIVRNANAVSAWALGDDKNDH